VEALTARTPTFTARELDKALSYGALTKDERATFRGEILAQQNVSRGRPDTEQGRYQGRCAPQARPIAASMC
jgi:hypothetical protein